MGRGKRKTQGASSPMAPRCASVAPRLTHEAARNLLLGFNVDGDESMEFLASAIASGAAPPAEVDEIFGAGLMAPAEDWDLMMACAFAMNHQRQGPRASHWLGRSCDMRDGQIYRGNNTHLFSCLDKLLGRDQSHEQNGLRAVNERTKKDRRPKEAKSRKRRVKSSYWSDELPQPAAESGPKKAKISCIKEEYGPASAVKDSSADGSIAVEPSRKLAAENCLSLRATIPPPGPPPSPPPVVKPKRGLTSRHFGGGDSPESAAAPSRCQQSLLLPPGLMRRRGTSRPPGALAVSGLPFPPLTAERFGLIQEELAHDPFQLLVAVRLLIKTAGRAAIPVFRQLAERYPTAADVAAADPDELLGMIQHLGLGVVRRKAMMRYARIWVSDPPSRDTRYGVKNYPQPGDGKDVKAGEKFGPEDGDHHDAGDSDAVGSGSNRGLGSAWEIGHITQGPYALDSWRIFCRDELLGRTGARRDCRGGRRGRKGGPWRDGEFQPEWMRVLPADKELRAYLRWMWMREGWDWDPETGERQVLAEELRRAVDERRVGYDDGGRLRIVS